MPHLFSFERLERDCVVFAGWGGMLSATNVEYLLNPAYIVVPGVLYNNYLIIYYSFNGRKPRLYRIKNVAVFRDGRYVFRAVRVVAVKHLGDVRGVIERYVLGLVG